LIRLAWIRLGKRVLVLTALLGAAACPGQGTTGQKSETTSQDDHATGQQSETTSQGDHGTKGTTQMTTIEQRWKVFDGPTLILEVSSVPGPIISTAAPPPGLKPVTHPFLSATARSAQHEHRLREILVASKDLGDFVSRLRAAGFEVRETPAH
jgi:hypothetical protein